MSPVVVKINEVEGATTDTLAGLLDGSRLSAVFDLSATDWAAIDARVTVVIADAPIADVVSKVVPNYSALLNDCRAWPVQTLPQLLALAGGTAIFAVDMVTQLQTMAGEIAGLTPDSPPPFLPSVALAAAVQDAAGLEASATSVDPVLAAFVAENRTADLALARVVGANWPAITGSLDHLESALADVLGGWHRICLDLRDLAQRSRTPTAAAWLAADLNGAIAGWQRVQQACDAFVSHAESATGSRS